MKTVGGEIFVAPLLRPTEDFHLREIDVMRAGLEPCEERIELAFLFGSATRGKEGPLSDIDLMIVGTVARHQPCDPHAQGVSFQA